MAGASRWSVTAKLIQQTSVPPPAEDKFVYADFERIENGRAVSNNGGLIQLFTAQESTPVKFKGQPNSSAPELVRAKGDEKNHLASFDYTLNGPNQWANVTLEIQDRPYQDQKPGADDLSAYKTMSLQLFATEAEYIRVEFISHGYGVKLDAGFPQIPLKIKPGLNTYVIPLKNLQQPSWVQTRVSAKDVLKALTAVSISAYCEQCTPRNGSVVVDNIVFQK
jgi:hypothetical protein